MVGEKIYNEISNQLLNEDRFDYDILMSKNTWKFIEIFILTVNNIELKEPMLFGHKVIFNENLNEKFFIRFNTPIATKFPKWDIPALDTLKGTKVYELRLKVINGEKLTDDEKLFITEKVNDNSYFKDSIPLNGWRFSFREVLKFYVVKQYDQWHEYAACNKTTLRKTISGRVQKIVEIID